MSKCGVILVVAGMAGLVVASELTDDRRVLAQAEASRPQSLPPPSTPIASQQAGDELAGLEREARVAATVALARLDLVLSRKALRAEQYAQAARQAQRVLARLRQLPPDVDVGEYELQAEGVLAKAARAGVNVEALAPATDDLPLLERRPGRAAQPRQLARNAPDHAAAGPAGDDVRMAPQETRRRTAADRHAYDPAAEFVDADAFVMNEDERLYRQAALEGAYKDSEVEALIDVDQSRVIPSDVVSYPDDWPEKTKRRARYRGGMIARTPSWYDKDGREWYVAIYDIHDLIFVPPDFTPVEFNPIIAQRNALDRDALRWGSQIFRGWPEDLAAGIPLLRYFGGVDDLAYRGPKYSLERQRQVVELIKAFSGPPTGAAKVVPLSP